jgi:hypothetical protein
MHKRGHCVQLIYELYRRSSRVFCEWRRLNYFSYVSFFLQTSDSEINDILSLMELD